MVGRNARISIAVFLFLDFLFVLVNFIWFYFILTTPNEGIVREVWGVFLLILWNSIPLLLGCILFVIGLRTKSRLFWGGMIGYILLGIGAHIIFQLNLLFNPDGLEEYAPHVTHVVSPFLGIIMGIIGFLFGFVGGLMLGNRSKSAELKILN